MLVPVSQIAGSLSATSVWCGRDCGVSWQCLVESHAHKTRAWDVNGEEVVLGSPKFGCEIAVLLSSPPSPDQRRGIVSVACATFIVYPLKPCQ